MIFRSREQRVMKAYISRLNSKLHRIDPITWATERFNQDSKSFKWSEYPEYKDHVWDGTPDPFLLAFEAISNGRDVGIEAATGVGKTFIAAKIAYWFLDTFPNAAVITTAPTKEQLLQVLWKEIGRDFAIFKKIRPNSVILTGEVRVHKAQKYNEDKEYGNRMVGKVGRKRSGEDSSVGFQGIHNTYQLFILDEGAALEASVYKAIDNTNTFKSKGAINCILALGNPDSQTDALHQFCSKKDVEHIVISGYDHPNIVCNRHIIPGAVTLESLELRKDEYGEESNFFKSRARGIAPTEAIDSLIKKAWIDNCTYGHTKFKKESKLQIQQLRDPDSFNAVGIDVANSIDGDKACVVSGDGNICNYIKEFQCPDASHLAYNLIWEDHKLMSNEFNVYGLPKLSDLNVSANNVGVDAVGVGVSTVNTFRNEGVNVIPLQGGQLDAAIIKDKEGKPLYTFTALRSQMFFLLSVDLQKGNIVLDLPTEMMRQLIKELCTIKYKVTTRGIQIEDKEEIKKRLGGKSPNVADAIAYWNWMRYNYYRGALHLPFA